MLQPARSILLALAAITALASVASPASLLLPEARGAGTTAASRALDPGKRTSGLPSFDAGWTSFLPTMDGTIEPDEWDAAQTYNISLSATPVTLYLMNDDHYLYIAVDNPVDVSLSVNDFMAFAFDDEGGAPPMLGDGMWTSPGCPSTEGVFRCGNLAAGGSPGDLLYRSWSAAGVCAVELASGMTGAYSDASGHMVYEMRVDLAASPFHALPGQSFFGFVGTGTVGAYTGATSNPASDTDPFTYAIFTLAPAPALAATNVLYATQGQNNHGLFTIDPATGAETLLGLTNVGPNPGLAISPDGELFATNTSGVSSLLYRLDAATGQAHLVGPTGLSYMDAIAFDRNGDLWGTGDIGDTKLYRIDKTSAVATPVGPNGQNIVGLAFDPTDGTLYGSTGGFAPTGDPDAICRIDLQTGAATVIGFTGLGDATPDLAFDVHGHLYGLKGGGSGLNTLISIDKATGIGTVIGGQSVTHLSGLASQAFLHPVAEHTIYWSQGNVGELLVTIDPLTGAGTPIGNTGISPMAGLAISPTGWMYAMTGRSIPTGRLYRIDPVTAQSFFIGDTGVEFFDSIVFDGNGQLWGIGIAGNKTLFQIDPADASVTPIGPTGEQLAGLAVDPTTGTMYASTGAGAANSSSIYRVDTSTGALTLVGTTVVSGFGGAIPDITFDAAGNLFGVIGGGNGNPPPPSTLLSINKFTGAAVAIGSVGIPGISGLDQWAYGTALDVPSSPAPVTRGMLQPARPNPFAGTTELRFTLERRAPVALDVFTVAGQHVARVAGGIFEPGEHLAKWNGRNAGGARVSGGIYFLRLQVDGVTETRKVVRLR